MFLCFFFCSPQKFIQLEEQFKRFEKRLQLTDKLWGYVGQREPVPIVYEGAKKQTRFVDIDACELLAHVTRANHYGQAGLASPRPNLYFLVPILYLRAQMPVTVFTLTFGSVLFSLVPFLFLALINQLVVNVLSKYFFNPFLSVLKTNWKQIDFLLWKLKFF